MVAYIEVLRTMLGNTMPKAASHLAQVVKTLDAYAGVAPPAAAPAAAPAEPGSPRDPAEAKGGAD